MPEKINKPYLANLSRKMASRLPSFGQDELALSPKREREREGGKAH